MSNLLVAVLIVYLVAYIYCINFAVYVSTKKGPIADRVNAIHRSCIYSKKLPILTKYRGSNYYINEGGADTDCILTYWGLCHFILYGVIAYINPNIFVNTQLMGVAFEVYEYFQYDCADPLDLVWNSSGYLFGKYLHRLQYDKKTL